MKYHIKRENTYSLASITTTKNPTVTAVITTDIHTESSDSIEAVQTLYAESLLSGTEKYSREEFLNAVNLLGASIDISIKAGQVFISLKSRSQQFSKLLKLTEEVILSPTFDKKELQRIKSTAINSLHQAKEDTRHIALAELRNQFYGKADRKYSANIDTLIQKVSLVTPTDVKKLHELTKRQNWTCSIAASTKECEQFESVIKKIKKQEISEQVLVPVHQQKGPKPKAVLNNIPSKTNIDFSIGAPLPITLHHPDFIPLSLGLNVLAKWGGFSGRLMSTVRELEGLTYGIYGSLEGFTGTEQGYWRIMTFFAPEKTTQGLTSTFREITKIHQEGITSEELKRFKTIMNTQQVLINDSIGGMLTDLHTYHIHGFTLDEMREHKAKMADVTLEEVNEAVSKYLNPKNLTVSGAGPVKAVKKDIVNLVKNVQ